MKERFETKRFHDKSLALIIRASEIIDGYQAPRQDSARRGDVWRSWPRTGRQDDCRLRPHCHRSELSHSGGRRA